jgi:uncharacterized membrane protein
MLILVLGLVIFLGLHLLPVVVSTRAGLVARLGAGGYRALMAIGSAVGLVLIVWGYDLARSAGAMVIWTPPRGMNHLVILLMLPVFPLLIAAYVPGKIRGLVKHPMLTAVKLWAFAHLLANGTLPDMILFASFLAWGVVDRISLKRRGVAPPPKVARFTTGDYVAIVVGLILYGLTIWRLHLLVIGVSPLG